jgi:hypothetical protein
LKIQSYYIGSPVEGLTKQYAIWGSGETNSSWPIVYLQKPKHIKAEKWHEICNSITLRLPQGFEL